MSGTLTSDSLAGKLESRIMAFLADNVDPPPAGGFRNFTEDDERETPFCLVMASRQEEEPLGTRLYRMSVVVELRGGELGDEDWDQQWRRIDDGISCMDPEDLTADRSILATGIEFSENDEREIEDDARIHRRLFMVWAGLLDPAESMDGYQFKVTDAGSSEYLGAWWPIDELWGEKPVYTNSNDRRCYFQPLSTPGAWTFATAEQYEAQKGGVYPPVHYFTTDDPPAPTPWEALTWNKNLGQDPVPTVTQV